MPAGAYLFYFEVTVVKATTDRYEAQPVSSLNIHTKSGRTNVLDTNSFVAVGFCEHNARRIGMPGWNRSSWGYHGDDGQKFLETGIGMPYGATYGAGDVVGCGVDSKSRSAFFTKNGEKQNPRK